MVVDVRLCACGKRLRELAWVHKHTCDGLLALLHALVACKERLLVPLELRVRGAHAQEDVGAEHAARHVHALHRAQRLVEGLERLVVLALFQHIITLLEKLHNLLQPLVLHVHLPLVGVVPQHKLIELERLLAVPHLHGSLRAHRHSHHTRLPPHPRPTGRRVLQERACDADHLCPAAQLLVAACLHQQHTRILRHGHLLLDPMQVLKRLLPLLLFERLPRLLKHVPQPQHQHKIALHLPLHLLIQPPHL
mmetsp:Transcript_33516/g.82376  ORF Transcript_33516/g.82376 Transcript_33516/m.82376 type:complete len:250 (-) Transcript_33516:266-1015(-)